MVGKTGFEPATPWSQTKCSTKLSHFPIYGALEGIRTPDLLVRSQTLYPTELRARDLNICQVIINASNTSNCKGFQRIPQWIATGNPAPTNQKVKGSNPLRRTRNGAVAECNFCGGSLFCA